MSRKLRIEPLALAALLAAAVCLGGAPAEGAPQRQAAPVTSSNPEQAPPQARQEPPEARESASVQQQPAASPARSEVAAAPTGVASAPQTDAAAAPQTVTTAGAGGADPSAAAAPSHPRFKVEAVGFRAVDESGPNYPDADMVFAVFESQQQSMTTRVFEEIDTGDAETFAASENCILPARDPDALRNVAWECSAEGAEGPITFAIGFYEIDPDFIGDYTQDFCSPQSGADVAGIQRNCDTDVSDLLFRTAFSYQSADILARLDPTCRCVSETVRYRESNGRGDVEYRVTFRITRTDEGGAQPNADSVAERIYRHGARSAALGQGFEFDGGVSAALGPDLTFSGGPAAMLLTPAGGAKIWPGDVNARGYAACSAERRSRNYVATAVAAPTVGHYACYVTNDGRVGELRVENLTTSFDTAVLSVSYTTWH